jgi:hypothetical protein
MAQPKKKAGKGWIPPSEEGVRTAAASLIELVEVNRAAVRMLSAHFKCYLEDVIGGGHGSECAANSPLLGDGSFANTRSPSA